MPRQATGQVLERTGKGGRTYALRFRALGARQYMTLGSAEQGWDRKRAEVELENVLADIRRGIWRPPEPQQPAAPREEPTFHEFASEWVDARRHELRPRSIDALEWALSCHLLPHFRSHKLSAITIEEVDRYRAAKVREREQGLVEHPLGNGSINKTIAILGAVLDSAIEYGHITSNPARGKRRRLKAAKPRRTWLEIDEVRSLLGAAGEHRALLATMTLAGLRVGEVVSLRWRDVDLARGVLRVAESKTDAGMRTVDLSPDLLDELKTHRAKAGSPEPDTLVFPTRNGTARDRNNVRTRVLAKTIERANKALAEAGRPAIQEGVTNHALRRTYASLLYEAGASPAYVMAQMGHTSSALALEIYARKMERSRDTGARMDALLKGADWAQTGTNSTNGSESLSVENTAGAAIPLRKRA
ncbi:MAG: site-specific integrase [Gaiellaceae bacterium]|jgi:integrase